MSFEAHEEKKLEARVDAVFNDCAGMTTSERIGVVAYKLLDLIDAERDAQDAERESWPDRDKDARKKTRKIRNYFGSAVLGGLAGMGMGFAGGEYFAAMRAAEAEGMGKIAPIDMPDELSDAPHALDVARENLLHEKIIQAEVHGLGFKEIKAAEEIARKLTPPKDF